MADGYKPSPRPTFDRPTLIKAGEVVEHFWGDPEAGRVLDHIYVSSSDIHVIVFEMQAGERFTHSEAYRTVFGADELLHVLEGTMVIANPETGEVVRAPAGTSVFFRKDTWHHAFAHGGTRLRVLEFFSPPPSTGSSGPYARTRPYLEDVRYLDERVGTVPGPRPRGSFELVTEGGLFWRRDLGVLEGVLASTEHLAVHQVEVNPGERSEARVHAGETLVYVTHGSLLVALEDVELRLEPGDAAYIPASVAHRYANDGHETAVALAGHGPGLRR
ncbi:MAG TPA: cupin domain-containing protein [Gaiellaceae bacterium]|jgi:quercetin dioxygenase-like cupin family protein|nr:cupin domain-containing protein [Gaiellaceae bacterium]